MKRIISIFLIGIAVINLVNAQRSNLKAKIEALEEKLKKDTEDVELILNLGILYHNLALNGNKNCIKRGEKLFKKLIRIDSDNALALCWYGSLLTIKGSRASLPFNKVRYVNDGMKKMDKAVELSPDNIAVRMIRANNSLALPEFFERLDTAIIDFEHILTLKEKKPDFFSMDILIQIYFSLGKAGEKKGDIEKAKEYWKKVVDLAPDSKQGIEAKALIK